MEGMPFASCMIRERKNSVYVVGDMGIDIRLLEVNDLDEANLKHRVIR